MNAHEDSTIINADEIHLNFSKGRPPPGPGLPKSSVKDLLQVSYEDLQHRQNSQ